MSDLISRQAAIEAIDSLYFDTVDDHDRAKEKIKRLPSAHPEIIRCKDCKHYEDGWIHCNRVTWWNGADDFCSRAERRTNEIN